MSLPSFTDRAVEVFKAFTGVPLASRAHICDGSGGVEEVEATWTQREMERGKKISFSKSYFLEKNSEGVKKVATSAFQADATYIVKVSYACGCVKRAVLIHDKSAKEEEAKEESQQYIEIWSGDALEKTITVSKIKDHGKINEDIHFGSFHISSDGLYLLYVAEKKKSKATSFFATPTTKDETPPPTRGAEFDYDSNWGDEFPSVVHPVPVVMEIATEEVTVIDTSKHGDISAGQAEWVPGEEGGVVFIGTENLPRKISFTYCLSCKSAIYYTNINTGEYTKLTYSDCNIYSPRFNPNGSTLIYFQSGGPHLLCPALKKIDWTTKCISTVVDVVARPKSPDDFPGFYTVFLPPRCYDNTGTRLICHNTWGSVMEVTCVDITTGTVTNVSEPTKKGAWLVLDVSHDLIVAQFASLNECPKLYIGALHIESSSVVWTEVSSSSSHVTRGLTWDRLHFKSGDSPGDLPYEGLLLLPPPTATPPPLVVDIHGGPHAGIRAGFLPFPVCFAALGFAVLIVNYRGSTGFGQDSVHGILGNIGTNDVKDVHAAVSSVVERGVVDGGHVCVIGGSHGGSIAAHLIGQYPESYAAAALRGPVIDMATMWAGSDVPEWCSVMCGLTFDPAIVPTAAELSMLRSKSPIIHIDKVRAPVLILIGGCDLRVPPSQGYLYYNTLRAQGKETRLLLYPGSSHIIAGVLHLADYFINAAQWFYRAAPLS